MRSDRGAEAGWFLQRVICASGLDDPLRLRFAADRYGPYDDQLRHLRNSLDGSYLPCDRRLADAGPFEWIRFEDTKRERVAAFLQGTESRQYLPALERAAAVIDGFESPLAMELLATVDWLLSRQRVEPTAAAVRAALRRWPGSNEAGRREQRLFDDRMLTVALRRLTADLLIDWIRA